MPRELAGAGHVCVCVGGVGVGQAPQAPAYVLGTSQNVHHSHTHSHTREHAHTRAHTRARTTGHAGSREGVHAP